MSNAFWLFLLPKHKSGWMPSSCVFVCSFLILMHFMCYKPDQGRHLMKNKKAPYPWCIQKLPPVPSIPFRYCIFAHPMTQIFLAAQLRGIPAIHVCCWTTTHDVTCPYLLSLLKKIHLQIPSRIPLISVYYMRWYFKEQEQTMRWFATVGSFTRLCKVDKNFRPFKNTHIY
jgi:hypothetical protein